MSVTQASDTEESMQVKIANDKQSKNGDEKIEGMSVSDMPEFNDPAILVVKESAKIRYSKEELIKLRDAPMSKKKPDFFDTLEIPQSILDPERWSLDRKKSSDAAENNSGVEHRRRPSGDPRERIRKENDGIVLSPQRRSFKSGCFVLVRGETTSRASRPHSPLGTKNEPSHMGIREIQPNARRIGSGRILRDSWDFNDKLEISENEGYGGFRNQRGTSGSEEKFERRSFGRDFEVGRDRENNNKETRRGTGRYDRRRISENRDVEEPEWFSGGPLSQNDTIELRGFDDEKPGKKKSAPLQTKRSKESAKKKEPPQNPDEKEKKKEGTPTPQADSEVESSKNSETNTKTETKAASNVKNGDKDDSKISPMGNDHCFNLDEFLKCDSIASLLPNGVGAEGDNGKSRFSRWFKQENVDKAESRCSSLDDEHNIIKGLLNDIGETNINIPGDSDAYFAPISPANNNLGDIVGNKSGNAQLKQPSQSLNIMEMLQRGTQRTEGEPKHAPPVMGKIMNLDELEAKMRQNTETNIPPKPQQKPDEEMTAAFKKLLVQAQAAGSHVNTANGPLNKTQPMSLLEMLNHSQQQDEAARLSTVPAAAHVLGPISPNLLHHPHPVSHHPHLTNDLTMKIQTQIQQQKQMDMLNKLINATTTVNAHQMRGSPLLDVGLQQQSRELLNRPEAQAILQGLKRGDITTQHLYQQLANPALQPRHREMLLTILKLQGSTTYGPSPRVLSPVPPHPMFQQQQQQPQQQQLRVSPLPPNAMHQRIPSPRELQVHTQNILQRALIKKKLEEQQENYRKKQEMQRGQSPNISSSTTQGTTKSISSPTPLAFTPTSVLRKMTADKDDGKETKTSTENKIPQGRPLTNVRPQPPPQQSNPQWNAQFGAVKQPAGRPIVKANNYQTQTPEQFFSQHQQQQRMFGPMQSVLSGSQQSQQRKPSTMSQFGGIGQQPQVSGGQYNQQAQYAANQQFSQQLTQQQLRAQHQHRPTNQAVGSGQQQQQPVGFQQQQQNLGTWQQLFGNLPTNRNVNNPMNKSMNDGDLSPTTTNQLAQWFPPDLLERARGGELPSTAGLAQHALSLEEIERQPAPPVHN